MGTPHKRITRYDNPFVVGRLITTIISHINCVMQVEINLRDFFHKSVIKGADVAWNQEIQKKIPMNISKSLYVPYKAYKKKGEKYVWVIEKFI